MKSLRAIGRAFLVLLIISVLWMFYIGWQNRETGRRASDFHHVIKEGMHMKEVVDLLPGNVVTSYAIHRGEEIDASQPDLEVFVSALEALDEASTAYGMAYIFFLGSTPLHVTLSLEVAPDGTVTTISDLGILD